MDFTNFLLAAELVWWKKGLNASIIKRISLKIYDIDAKEWYRSQSLDHKRHSLIIEYEESLEYLTQMLNNGTESGILNGKFSNFIRSIFSYLNKSLKILILLKILKVDWDKSIKILISTFTYKFSNINLCLFKINILNTLNHIRLAFCRNVLGEDLQFIYFAFLYLFNL